MTERTIWALVLLACSAACSTEVTVFGSGGNGGDGGSGNGGAGNGGGNGGSGNGGGHGGAGGSVCGDRPNDAFDMLLETPEDGSFGCGLFFESATGTYTLSGIVTQSSPEDIVIDTCPPDADCAFSLNRLYFSAPGLDNPIPGGALVEVSVRVEIPMGCSHELVVRNLAEWSGMKNPIYDGDVVWLAAADGVPQAPPNAPFAVNALPLGCYPEPEDDYRLEFSTQLALEPLVLDMGGEAEWYWDVSVWPEYHRARNLRSFETGFEDDYWNWGYWMTGAPQAIKR
jgi:hypothetical protein